MTEFNDEMEVVKNQLTASARELLNQKVKLGQISESIEVQRKRLQSNQMKSKAAELRLKDVTEGVSTKEQAARDAEQTLAEAAKGEQEMTKQMKHAKDELAKDSRALFKEREEEAILLGEISGAQSALKNINVDYQCLS
jgi:hypothetical protein